MKLLILGISLALSSLSLAEGSSEFIYLFDEPDNAKIIDSGVHQRDIPLGKNVIVSEDAKFGNACLEIGAGGVASKTRVEASQLQPIEAMTISIWIRLEREAPVIFLWRQQNTETSPGLFRFYYSARKLWFAVRGEAGVERASVGPLQPYLGQWTHIAMTYHKGLVTFYVNGVPAGPSEQLSGTEIPALHADGVYTQMGGYDAPEGTRVDDFAFFDDRALDEEAMLMIYSDGLQAYLQSTR